MILNDEIGIVWLVKDFFKEPTTKKLFVDNYSMIE